MKIFELIKEAYFESGIVSKYYETVTPQKIELALVYLINLFIFKSGENVDLCSLKKYGLKETNEVFESLVGYLCSLYNIESPSKIRAIEISFSDSYK